METAIVIIVCLVFLCIIPNIGTRRPRGHQPTRRVENPVSPNTLCGSVPDTGKKTTNPLLNRPQNPDLDIIIERH